MTVVIKILGILWAAVGLANLLLLTRQDVATTYIINGPGFNAAFFLTCSAVLLVMVSLSGHRQKSAKRPAADAGGNGYDSQIEARLLEIKSLRAKGLLSTKEYKIKREQIIKEI